MKRNCIRFLTAALLAGSGACTAHAGNWSAPTTISDIGSWAIWYAVVVNDTTVAPGCAANGGKAIDITTVTPVKQAQMSLLLAAFAAGKQVKLYYESCASDGFTSLITNVHIVN